MEKRIDPESAHQRGLRIGKAHAEELVKLYGAHAQSEFYRADDLLLINYAHVVMLCGKGIISREEARQILKSIKKLEAAGVNQTIHLDPRVGDLSTHIEAHIIKETGPEVGGKIHTGRSRNDIYPTLTRMLLRRSLLEVCSALVALEESLLLLVSEHRQTVLPGYTHHSQHAQPITLGYYFLGNFDVFLRDLDRFEDLWPRLNRCPMGAAALATTGFPLDRNRMAVLLAFDNIHEHAYDAISSRDFLLEFLFILSTIASDLGRIAENILLWNTFEFGMVVLADEYTSFSTIMPQKKNPVAIESLRALNPIVTGKLFNAFGILKSESWCNGRETTILDDDSVGTGRQVSDMILLLNGVLKTMQVKKERMHELARKGFSTVTELADTLVRECGFSFRTAHEVVGSVVKKAVDGGLDSTKITSAMVEKTIKELLKKDLKINPKSLRKALDPIENIQMRHLPGGPAFEEVTRMLGDRIEVLRSKKEFILNCKSKIAEAYQNLRQEAGEIIKQKKP
jgi:argininosuccinate lyase